MTATDKSTVAIAAMAAMNPLVELLLELGVTSPQAESLFRGLFVHQARSWLARKAGDGAEPSDARIALVTGVHRNFVRQILAEHPKIAKNREQKRNGAAQLLEGWYSDPRYLDGSGRPRELPIRGGAPSFEALVTTYLPGSAPGVVKDELERLGSVEPLPGGRVRARAKSLQRQGINLSNLASVGEQARAFLETLIHNLRFPNRRRYVESAEVAIDEGRVVALREILNQRASAFLAQTAEEFSSVSAEQARKRKGIKKISLTVFTTER